MKVSWPLVEVIWLDAVTVDRGGWVEASELDKWKRGSVCHSVGYLHTTDNNKISLVSHFNCNATESDIEQVSGTFIIPKDMVLKIRKLH